MDTLNQTAAYVAAILQRIGQPVEEGVLQTLPAIALPAIPEPTTVPMVVEPGETEMAPPPDCPAGPEGTGLTSEQVWAVLQAMQSEATTRGISSKVIREAVPGISNQEVAGLRDWFTERGIVGHPDTPDPEGEAWRRQRPLLVTDLDTMIARLKATVPEQVAPIAPEQEQVAPIAPEQEQGAPIAPAQEQVAPIAPEQEQVAPIAPEQGAPTAPEQEQGAPTAPELSFPHYLINEGLGMEHLTAIFDAMLLVPNKQITSRHIRDALQTFAPFRDKKAQDFFTIYVVLLEWFVSCGILEGPATPDTRDNPWRKPRKLLVAHYDELLSRLQNQEFR